MEAVICGSCGRPRAGSTSICNCVPTWFWTEPDVEQAVEQHDAAAVIRLLRRRIRSLTQEHIGLMCDLSQSTISRIESGRSLEGARARHALKGMGAPAPGRASQQPAPALTPTGELVALREIVSSYDLPQDGPVRSLDHLQRCVSGVIQDRLNSRYSRLLHTLPDLLAELTRALYTHGGTRRAQAAALLVQAYRAADAIADKNGLHDLSASLIHIMRWAAEQAEDASVQAAVTYVRAQTFFTTRNFELGRHMLEKTAQQLDPASAHAQAAYGALHMRAAVLAARSGNLQQGRDHLAEARDAAKRTEEGVYAGTAFGPGSVRIHEVTLAVDAGEPVDALAAAAGWTPPQQIPAERRSHFFVDLARAQADIGQYELALEALQTAWRTAPEHLRVHPQARQLLGRLTHRPGHERHAALAFIAAAGIPSGGLDRTQ